MYTTIVAFDKYNKQGAYHWEECNRSAGLFYNPSLEARYKLLVEKVTRIKNAKNLLDVGCGDGYLVAQMSPLLKMVIGVEFEGRAIDLAKEKLIRFPNCKLFRGSCYDLPFEDDSFDIVFLTDVIEHLEDPMNCLKEISRVLQPWGSLILSTPKWRPDRVWDRRHVREYRPEELRTCLKTYFNRVEMTYFWPIIWSNVYSTKLGWRLVKHISRYYFNPFMRESAVNPDNYGQIMAICRRI
jgi:SAM-dependent methyltransferase